MTEPGCIFLCYSIFCYRCMFAFVVFDLVFQYYAKILAGKNVSKMTYLCRVGCKTLTQSINQYL